MKYRSIADVINEMEKIPSLKNIGVVDVDIIYEFIRIWHKYGCCYGRGKRVFDWVGGRYAAGAISYLWHPITNAVPPYAEIRILMWADETILMIVARIDGEVYFGLAVRRSWDKATPGQVWSCLKTWGQGDMEAKFRQWKDCGQGDRSEVICISPEYDMITEEMGEAQYSHKHYEKIL